VILNKNVLFTKQEEIEDITNENNLRNDIILRRNAIYILSVDEKVVFDSIAHDLINHIMKKVRFYKSLLTHMMELL
jgi:hypothetical protein